MSTWLPALLAGSAAAAWAARATAGTARLATVAGVPSAGVPRPVSARRRLDLVMPLGAALLWGAAAAAVALAAVLVARRALARRRQSAETDRERTTALDALALLAADLRAGRTPAEALAAAASVARGPTGRALAAAATAARLGGDVPAALDLPGSAVPAVLPGLAACWRVCHDAGSGLARAVERLEEGLRAAEAQRRAVTAELAGPTATAQLLAVLPVGGIALAAGLGADPLRFLFHTPLGLGCLVLGLLLDAAGVLWTRRLAAGALR